MRVDEYLGTYVKVKDKEIYGRVYRIEDDMLYIHSVEFKDGSIVKGDKCVEDGNVGAICYGWNGLYDREAIDLIVSNWKDSIMNYIDGEM